MVQNSHKGMVTYLVTRMVTRWKIDNYGGELCTYFTERTFSSTSGNVLKTVTVENGTKFP